MNEEIITQIVGQHFAKEWIELNPKIYYKDEEPYGLVAMFEVDGVIYIASTVTHEDMPFTIGMIRDWVKVAKVKETCIITDVPSKFVQVKGFFDKIGGFSYTFKNNVMFTQGKIRS